MHQLYHRSFCIGTSKAKTCDAHVLINTPMIHVLMGRSAIPHWVEQSLTGLHNENPNQNVFSQQESKTTIWAPDDIRIERPHDWLIKGCFTIRVHLQKLHSSPVLTVEAYFDFKVLLPKH